jgi:hypothetical protein
VTAHASHFAIRTVAQRARFVKMAQGAAFKASQSTGLPGAVEHLSSQG